MKANVEDIDKDDKENHQMATEYINEIYSYMRKLEKLNSAIRKSEEECNED